MKKLLILILLAPLFAYSQLYCTKNIKIGNIDVCFPVIEGMTESYSNSNVKILADTFKGTDDEIIFAIYAKEENLDYSKMLENGLGYPSYKLYGNKRFIDIDIDQELYNMLKVQLKKTLGKDLTKVIKRVNGRLDKINDIADLNFETPLLIESRSINNRSTTNTLLMKMTIAEEIQTMVANLSVLVIKNKLIFFANYNIYNGSDSIDKTNDQSNIFIKKIFSIN